MYVPLPPSHSPLQPLWHQSLELRLELRVEPAVEDGVGESRGHGDRVAEAQAQEEGPLVVLRLGRGIGLSERWFQLVLGCVRVRLSFQIVSQVY